MRDSRRRWRRRRGQRRDERQRMEAKRLRCARYEWLVVLAGPLHSLSTHHIADCITRRSRSSNLSCRGLDPYIVGGIPGGRDFQLVFLALLA